MTELTSRKVYAYLSGNWIDITSDVQNQPGVRVFWGIRGNRETDLVADVGDMKFTLSNREGKYSPSLPGALSGWKTGVPVKLVLAYDGVDYVRFYGKVARIDLRLAENETEWFADITVLDWMDYASRQPITNPGALANKTGNDVITTALALMPIQPLATDLDTGLNTFPTVFDVNTEQTTIYGEFSKVAFSEFGRVYLRKDTAYGETLVFDQENTRNGLRLLKEVDTGVFAIFSSGFMGMDLQYGSRQINEMTLRIYPRRVDASAVVLFKLDDPLIIASGQTITIKGNYADPSGGLPVNGQNMITPVATTDYLMNTKADGTGTDKTADLVLVSTTYGSDGFSHEVQNDSVNVCYITKYQYRGYGVYQYNPVEDVQSNQTSIDAYGYFRDEIQQRYQGNFAQGRVHIEYILETEKSPRLVLNRVTFSANRSDLLMRSFLNCDVDSLIQITDAATGINGYYYIQAVEFTIAGKGLIMFSWILKEMVNLSLGLLLIGVNMQAAAPQAIDYGFAPRLQNISQKSFSVWIYPTDKDKTLQTIMALGSVGSSVNAMFTIQVDAGSLWLDRYYDTGLGEWVVTNVIANNTLYHIVVVHDSAGVDTPEIYINGVLQTIDAGASTVPAGGSIINSDTASPLTLGATFNAATGLYTEYFKGNIYAPRIYNRLLTQTDVDAIYAAGAWDTAIDMQDATNILTDGLIFQGICVPEKQVTFYDDQTLTSALPVFDCVNGLVGTAQGSPIGISDGLTRNTVTLDAASSGTTANGTTKTLAHTVSQNDDRLLVVAIAKRAYANAHTSTVTYGTQNLTRYAAGDYAVGNYPRYEIWYAINPPVGTANVVVTLPNNDWFEVSAISYYNVDQDLPFRKTTSTTGTSATPSLTITSGTDGLVFDILSIERGSGVTLTADAGQTERMDASADNNWAGGVSTEPGAASVTTGWTISASPKNWIYAVFALNGSIVW